MYFMSILFCHVERSRDIFYCYLLISKRFLGPSRTGISLGMTKLVSAETFGHLPHMESSVRNYCLAPIAQIGMGLALPNGGSMTPATRAAGEGCFCNGRARLSGFFNRQIAQDKKLFQF